MPRKAKSTVNKQLAKERKPRAPRVKGVSQREVSRTATDNLELKLSETGVSLKAKGYRETFSNFGKAIGKGIGNFYRPLGDVLQAKADRKVANEKASAIIDVTRKQIEYEGLLKQLEVVGGKSIDKPLLDRAASHFVEDLIDKQVNRESVAMEAGAELDRSPPEEDADTPVDDDWLNQFWRIAENATSEQLRSVFAKILAAEVAKPGTVSPLTLSVVTCLTRPVAEAFVQFCRLSMRKGADVIVIHPHVHAFQNIGPLEQYGVTLDNLFEFESYGLLRSAETIMLNYSAENPWEHIEYAGRKGSARFADVQLHILQLTRVGADLRNILDLHPIAEYTAALQAKLGDLLKFD